MIHFSKYRWRSKEPHDVLIDCEKVSLEPNSCQLQESETLSSVCSSRQSSSDATTSESSGILTNSDNSMQHTASEDERQNMATQTGSSLQNAIHQQGSSLDSGTDVSNSTPLVASSAMLNSPTTLCSLSTPPSSKNTSPSGSVLDVSIGHTTPIHLNSSHHEGADVRLTLQTPTPLDQSRRSNCNHHTANSFAVIDDSSASGRSTPPIVLNSRKTPSPFKGKGNTSTNGKKDDKDVDDSTPDLSTEQKSETIIRAPTTEKYTISRQILWDVVETLQPFTTNICRKCLGNCLGASSNKNADWESQLSPAQLLDHYLLFGQSLQKGKLNR